MKKLVQNPILYLHEYKNISEEYVRWKNDEDLRPWQEKSLECGTKVEEDLPEHLCVGIGTYKTLKDGEIYLCALIDPETRQVKSYSMGVYKSAELVDKALELLYAPFEGTKPPVIIRSSRNALYCGNTCKEAVAPYPVQWELTEKGTRGGVTAVSTFFSQLMRKKGGFVFQSWQDAVDWLCSYIFQYNQR